jgi:flagellar basal-body rod protein FlgB
VSGISDQAVIDTLRRQMTMAVARQVASAGNLANIDTPGYRAVEPTFRDALEISLAATHPAHIAPPASSVGPMKPVEGPARRDGNTVQLDRELLAMVRAAGDFTAAQTALAAKFRLVRYAINEGR